MRKLISNVAKQQMIDGYLAGATAKQAAKLIGCSGQTCLNVLRELGYEPRPKHISNRRYQVNLEYFKEINTDEKAYWLGFLTADGSIHRNCISITLQRQDKCHLFKFLRSVGSNSKVRDCLIDDGTGKKHESARVSIGCKPLVEQLEKLGVTSRKSLIVKPCGNVPKHLMVHYWRGVFDGDGGISYVEDTTRQWIVSLTGTYPILRGFRKFMSLYTHGKPSILRRSTVCSIVYGGVANPQKVVAVLYDNGNNINNAMCLTRKVRLAKTLLQQRVKWHRKRLV